MPVTNVSTEAPPTTTEQGEKPQEEEGFPMAAVAGGVAGVLLIAGVAGGGVAYSHAGGGSEAAEINDVQFEAMDEAGENQEADTVIDITEEDDYWADGGDVQ